MEVVKHRNQRGTQIGHGTSIVIGQGPDQLNIILKLGFKQGVNQLTFRVPFHL